MRIIYEVIRSNIGYWYKVTGEYEVNKKGEAVRVEASGFGNECNEIRVMVFFSLMTFVSIFMR